VTGDFPNYSRSGYKTEGDGASFRNKGEDKPNWLAAIYSRSAPSLLGELAATSEPLPMKLDAAAAQALPLKQVHLDEKTFRFNSTKTHGHGKNRRRLRKFAADIVKFAAASPANL